MNNIADPQQQWTTRLFPNSTAMSQHLVRLFPPQQWMMVLFPPATAIMKQIANLYPQMQMQGHALPWYPLQVNRSAGYTWEGYPLQCGGVLPQAPVVNIYPPEGYSHNVYPPPQHVDSTPNGYPNHVYPLPQLVDSPLDGYPDDVYPPPQQVDFPPQGYPNYVYPPPQQVDFPPEGYLNYVYPPPQQVDSPPEGYPNHVYPPPPQQFNGLNFSEGMCLQSHTHNQIGGGQNNPQIQAVAELKPQGNINMGSNGGNTYTILIINNIHSIHLRGNRTIDNSLDDLAASNIPGSKVLLLYRRV